MIVEDEAAILIDMACALQEAGYRVIEVTSADKARRVLEEGARVDLVCTDVRMPGSMDGLGLTRWLKASRPDLPVIIVSGEMTARGVPASADAHLTKPVDMCVLLRRVAALLEIPRSD